jgi:preprotein translocase subunit SecG
MYALLLVLHLIICLALIGVVLIQSGKGGGLAGGAFGGSAQTVFGGRGATDFITRATMVLGGLFFVTSLVLAMMSAGLGNRPTSILQRESRNAAPAPGQAPARTPGGTSPSTPPAGTSAPPAGSAPATPSAPPSSGGR